MPTPANTTTPLLTKPAIPHMTASYLSSIHQYLPEPDYPNLTCQAFPNLTSTRPAVNLHAFPNLPHPSIPRIALTPLAIPAVPHADSPRTAEPNLTESIPACRYMPFRTPRCLDSPFLSCQTHPFHTRHNITTHIPIATSLTCPARRYHPYNTETRPSQTNHAKPATPEEGH